MSSTKRKKRKISNLPTSLKRKNNVTMKQCNNETINKLSKYLITFGYCFLVIGVLIFTLTFYPVIKEEINYQISTKRDQNKLKKVEIKPLDKEFGIVIPKIGANAKIVPNVDPYNEKEYQWQLTKGVAHAKGTSLPGQIGNTFIFAHSSGDWYTANRYNSVFYLLNKLEKDDDIYLYYQNQKFHYKVSEKKIVDSTAIDYLVRKKAEKIVTLMTCWPPGTTLKRLLVIGKLK